MVQVSEQMREYETIYVLTPDLNDQAARDLMLRMKDMVQKKGGKSIRLNCLGRKKLAWECSKKERGIFVHHTYLGQPGIAQEYNRSLGIDENVLLRQTVVRNKDVDPALRSEEPDQLEVPVVSERREPLGRRDDMGFEYDTMMDEGSEV